MQIGRPIVKVNTIKGASFAFYEGNDYCFPKTDFDDCHFSGSIVKPSEPFTGNFRSCTLQKLHCDGMAFLGADLLDCQIAETTFSACDFDTSHMAGCILRDVVMSEVRITNINFSQNVFKNVVFDHCVFDAFVFKNSRFYDCEFRNCGTSNHTFDTCFFDQVEISGLKLFPSTILMNIGIRVEDISNAVYFNDREIVGGVKIEETDFISQVTAAAAGLQEKISVAIFSSRDTEKLVERVTAVLASDEHVSNAISRGFIEKLDLLVTIFNLYYNEGRVFALNILQLQEYLNNISAQLAGNPDKLTAQFRSQIDSLRFVNSEQAAEIVRILEVAHKAYAGAQLVALLGSEDLSLSEFREILQEHKGVRVIEVRPRRSPVAVFVELLEASALIWLISTIVTTRFRYQMSATDLISNEQDGALAQLHDALPNAASTNVSAISSPIRTERSLELGLISRESMDIGIRVSSAFQDGLIKKFELSISPKRAVEFQKNLLGLIGSYTRSDK